MAAIDVWLNPNPAGGGVPRNIAFVMVIPDKISRTNWMKTATKPTDTESEFHAL
jgi:hypothetical protein